jgi:hypothetical protein
LDSSVFVLTVQNTLTKALSSGFLSEKSVFLGRMVWRGWGRIARGISQAARQVIVQLKEKQGLFV